MIKLFRNTKTILFKFPKKNKILFYDYIPANIINEIIGKKNYSYIFNYTSRKIYLIFIFLIFFDLKAIQIFFAENLITSYTYLYIKYIDPKVIITSTDNNLNFYRLKKYLKNIKFAALQNGSRHELNDLFGNPDLIFCNDNKKRFSADIIYTFNDEIGKLYKRYIDTKTISIGNFRNNLIGINNKYIKDSVMYISQFRKSFLNKKDYYSYGKKVSTMKKWFEVESKLLPILFKYCEDHKLSLTICGSASNKEERKIEKQLFKRMINNSKWKYWNNKKHFLDVYKFANKFEIIVCIWSTLGYELFSKYKKVVFFRQNIKNIEDRNFGWPAKFNEKGSFYTSKININEVSRVLNYARKTKQSEWNSSISFIKKKIMIYDRKNKILKRSIKNLYD
jgi:surface carbohydrate biosynthesis protein